MPTKKNQQTPEVSPNNPCPFLRALVAQGQLDGQREPLGHLSRTISRVARSGDGQPQLPAPVIHAIALIAHGLLPWQTARTQLGGLRPDELRDGPLDKHGVGSGILDSLGQVNVAELDRLDDFASDYPDASGRTERGLGLPELQRMMDANFERAKGRRRVIDRQLMDGEWPVLLKVMGVAGQRGRYLSLDDVRRLFTQRRLPQRIVKRMEAR